MSLDEGTGFSILSARTHELKSLVQETVLCVRLQEKYFVARDLACFLCLSLWMYSFSEAHCGICSKDKNKSNKQTNRVN